MNQIFIILISLSGLFFGYLLSRIAPEELDDGRKYFLLTRNILFVGISLLSIVYLIINGLFILLSIFVLFSIILILLELKYKNIYFSLIAYPLFIILLFYLTEIQLLLAVLIFIFGLPIGTLLSDEK